MYLTGEVKFNFRVVISFSIQVPFTLCQVNQMAIFILCNICLLESCKLQEFFLILTGDPTGLVKRQSIKLNRCAVFMQQAILDHFKLQFSHTTNDLFISAKLCEQLSNAFIC